MIYAIEEINNRDDLLPNITLGYDIRDTCSAVSKSLEAAIDFVASLEIEDIHFGDGRTLAVIGASNSATSVPVASVMGIFNIPMISYSSTSRLLSDRILYKSFFRTVPSDANQAVAMAELVSHFGWKWVGTIAADDSYGRPGIEQFISEAEVRDVCISFRKLVTSFPTEGEIKDVVSKIAQNPDAKVLVTFIHFAKIKLILEEVTRQGITDRIWIASEAWADNNEIATLDLRVIVGTHGILLTLGEIPGFGDYLQDVNPFDNNFSNPFLNELWEKSFGCVLPTQAQVLENKTLIPDTDTGQPFCSADHSIKETPSYKPTGLWGTYRTYLAVSAIARALEDIRTCVEPQGLLLNGTCPSLETLQPWQLLKYISEVNFTGTDRRNIRFSETGDVSALYHVVNWQESASDNGVDFIQVGTYDGSAVDGAKLKMNGSNIVWSYGAENDQVPVSVCSEPCNPGTRKGVIPGAPSCCFECVPCLDGEISNTTGASTCASCPVGFWSNEENTKCNAKSLNYLSWTEAGGLTMIVLTSIGILFTVLVTCLFIKNSNTPVVKASNRDLSFLLLTFVAICYASVFFYLGIPTDIQCLVQTPLRSCGFTGCVSILLVKTHSVLRIFEAKLPSSLQKRRCVGTRLQIIIVLILVFIQLLIYIITAVFVPPEVIYNNDISKTVTYVECKDVTVAPTVVLVLYTWTIAGVCLGFAIRARRLPENFNETKHIMFAMLVYFVVWLTYFPAFLWTYGKYKALAQCVVLIASSYGMLLCVFGPKCFILIFKPQLNTPAAVRKLTMEHSARRASSAVDAAGRKRSSSSLSSSHHSLDTLRVHTVGRKPKQTYRSPSSVRFQCDVDAGAETKSWTEKLKDHSEERCGVKTVSYGIDNPIDIIVDEERHMSVNECESDILPDSCGLQDKNTIYLSQKGKQDLSNNNDSGIVLDRDCDGNETKNVQYHRDNAKSVGTAPDKRTCVEDTLNDMDNRTPNSSEGDGLDRVENSRVAVKIEDADQSTNSEVLERRSSCLLSRTPLSSLSTGISQLSDVGDDDVFLSPFTNREFFKHFTCNCSQCRGHANDQDIQPSESETVDGNTPDEDENKIDGVFVTIEAQI
ncbi:extracellular calcium-sensing receptor-like [Ptychodera flava]|uniref:extracellular calcium-sensing receptor-like n=1 Tax=Ptychodera flava TaxID=63121 RepID=UPI00396A2CC5